MNRTSEDFKNIKRTPLVGMSPEDVDRYSLTRAFAQLAVGSLNGLEGEMSAEVQRGMAQKCEGAWIPNDVLFTRGRRDLSVAQFNAGGALVPTEIPRGVIELLRNRMICKRLGCTILDGLQGNLAIPRETSAATVQSVSESGEVASSTQSLDQVPLVPHRVAVTVKYTRQLLIQSSPSLEAWLRNDLVAQLALKWDFLMLQGAGADNEPAGILNTPGIGSIMFGGPATYAKIVAFETALSVMNADVGTMSYATTPSVKAAWKLIARALTGATVVSSMALWEDFGDGTGDGKVNGYRAAATNQILNNAVVFGHWADAVLGLWGNGQDVIVNPYSDDTLGLIRTTINTYLDIAIRHAQSFCWSADPGNQ